MTRLIVTTIASLLLALPALTAGGEDRPIPQDPKKQEQAYVDKLAWNRRTLVGAYDKVGKKSPRWDKPARQALEAAARLFSQARDPLPTFEEVYAPAKLAVDAGCSDPLILYLYARSSYNANYPGPQELERRYVAAARAMEASAYPPFRKAVALEKAAWHMAIRKDLSAEDRQLAARFVDASVALIPSSLAKDERNRDMENNWFEIPARAISTHRRLTGDLKAAFDRVDALLARSPAAKAVRLQVKGAFLIDYAWEARGTGYADTVTPEGFKKMEERLTEAGKALEEAWKLRPNDANTATRMITVNMGLSGDRQDMEKWFERAMKADGNNKAACEAKMEWLDPKWHGTTEELLAFGRACRDTKNWRAGITLLGPDSHRRAALRRPEDEKPSYMHSKEVWNDIKAVYEEYLQHNPHDFEERSFYAAYCFMCRQYVESDKQFKIVGDDLSWKANGFPEKWMKEIRAYVADVAREAEAAPKK
jgi:hypothetical protein